MSGESVPRRRRKITVSVVFSPHTIKLVDDLVEAGKFASVSDAMDKAALLLYYSLYPEKLQSIRDVVKTKEVQHDLVS